jgi:hypothetical protein
MKKNMAEAKVQGKGDDKLSMKTEPEYRSEMGVPFRPDIKKMLN